MKKIFLSLIIILLITQVVAVSAISDEALEAQSAIELAEKNITEMKKADFNVQRVNDILTLANEEYDKQMDLEERDLDYDYSEVHSKVDEIKVIRDESFFVYDELKALELLLENEDRLELNQTFSTYDKAVKEFENERYTQSLETINQVYDVMGEEQASQTTLRVFYETTSTSIKSFLIDNWKEIIYTIIAIIVISLITYNRMSIQLTKNKIRNLENKKEVLKKLIRDAQKDYFEKGKISDTEYHIKIGKFSEMIRDIERQLPLLNEMIAKKKKKSS